MLFSRKPKKPDKTIPADFSAIAGGTLSSPAIVILKKLFAYEKAQGSVPASVLQAVVQKIDPSYRPVGLHCIHGEGAIIKAVDGLGQLVCLKIVRPQYNAKFLGDTKNQIEADKDAWHKHTLAVSRFNERFKAGVQIQIALKKRINEDKFECLDIPEYKKFSDTPFLYLEQEWIEGRQILSWLKEKNNVLLNMEYFKYLLDCVEFIHDCGYIHRDLKSNNIMISGKSEEEYKIVIVDWTTAKLNNYDRNLTIAAEGIGTPGYASPINFLDGNAKDSDFQDDIYSLGMCLLEFWHMDSMPKMAFEHWGGEKKVQAFLDQCTLTMPEDLAPIFSRATAIKKENRYKKVGDFSSDLVKATEKMADRETIEGGKIVDVGAFVANVVNDLGESTHDTIIDDRVSYFPTLEDVGKYVPDEPMRSIVFEIIRAIERQKKEGIEE